MSTPRDFVITALVCCVMALGAVAWRQHQSLMRWAQGEARVAVLPESTLAPGEEIAEPAGTSPERVRAWNRAPLTVRARLSETASPMSQRQLAGVVEMLEDPRFLRAVASHQRSMLDARFGELFGRLDLSEEELESLRALLIEKQNAAMDVMMVSRGELAGQMGGSEMKTATKRAQEEIDGLIRQTLGEARYAVYKAYEQTLPQRAAVAQLQQRLSYTPEPLAPAQVEALVAVMAESGAEVRPALPGVSVVVDPEERQAVPIMHSAAESVEITPAVIESASKVLNPRQLAALHELQEEQEAAAMVVELARSNMPDPAIDRLDILDGLEVQLLLQ